MANSTYIIRIGCDFGMTVAEVSKRIHEQLVGNPDYIANRIVLNADDENFVTLAIGSDCIAPIEIEI